MKKLIIIISALVALGVLIYFLTPLFLPAWQTYANSRYEFQIDVPSDWDFGELETNNAGREFHSPDGSICYAYGFANALLNDNGDPQNLTQFIDWLTEGGKNILEKNKTTLDGHHAICILEEYNNTIKESVYALGDEVGIGFFCSYETMEQRNNNKSLFNIMLGSMRIDSELSENLPQELGSCEDYLSGLYEPLADRQLFYDDKYTEVTMTSREYWDRSLLPKEVRELEEMGYMCYPMPLEFDGGEPEGDVLPEPSVTMVEWSCELEYNEWEYSSTKLDGGFTCEKQECWTDENDEDYVWLCTK